MPVDVASVSNPDDQNQQNFFANLVDDPVVSRSDAVDLISVLKSLRGRGAWILGQRIDRACGLPPFRLGKLLELFESGTKKLDPIPPQRPRRALISFQGIVSGSSRSLRRASPSPEPDGGSSRRRRPTRPPFPQRTDESSRSRPSMEIRAGFVAASRAALQNRASLPELTSVIQKLTPSLQAPTGSVFAPVAKDPSVVSSAAFHSETLSPLKFASRMRCPSNAAAVGTFKPLPVRVASTAPVEARTTETELEIRLGTQTFVPSKTGKFGSVPTVTVCKMAPEPSSLRRVPAVK